MGDLQLDVPLTKGKKDDGVNDRMCIVTRERGEADDLIRLAWTAASYGRRGCRFII